MITRLINGHYPDNSYMSDASWQLVMIIVVAIIVGYVAISWWCEHKKER